MSQTPAGWYPDANGTIRWWDGMGWTEHTQPAGPTTPPPSAAEQTLAMPEQQPQQWVPQGQPGPESYVPGLSWGAEQPWAPAPARRRVRPWMLIAAGVVVLLAVVGVVLGLTLGGSSSTSTQAFCSTLTGLPADANLTQATAAISAKGLPDDIPANARHGFALYQQYAAQLDRAGSMSNTALAALVGGASNLSDMQAFNAYISTTCGSPAPQPSAR